MHWSSQADSCDRVARSPIGDCLVWQNPLDSLPAALSPVSAPCTIFDRPSRWNPASPSGHGVARGRGHRPIWVLCAPVYCLSRSRHCPSTTSNSTRYTDSDTLLSIDQARPRLCLVRGDNCAIRQGRRRRIESRGFSRVRPFFRHDFASSQSNYLSGKTDHPSPLPPFPPHKQNTSFVNNDDRQPPTAAPCPHHNISIDWGHGLERIDDIGLEVRRREGGGGGSARGGMVMSTVTILYEQQVTSIFCLNT